MKAPRAASALAVLALCSLLFGVMAVLAKAAAFRLPGPQVAFVRFLFGLLACAIVSVRRPLRARNMSGLVWRGAFGGAAVLCYFLCIEHLPVGIATLINYTAPVFTAVWAALFLGESLDAASIGALALATCGVLLVSLGTSRTTGAGGVWLVVGACSAILSGAAVAVIRQVRGAGAGVAGLRRPHLQLVRRRRRAHAHRRQLGRLAHLARRTAGGRMMDFGDTIRNRACQPGVATFNR